MKLKKIKQRLKEKDVLLALAHYKTHLSRYEFMMPNTYVQRDSEADLFGLRKNGLCDEFEVKTTRVDFLNDSKKMVRVKNSKILKQRALVNGDMIINYFWYVLAEGIADIDELPDYAGLITINEKGSISVQRKPKKLHDVRLTSNQKYKIARKAVFRYWDLKTKLH